MDLLREEDLDSLGALEDRIRQAIEMVARMRRERDAAVAERQAAIAERDAAVQELETLRAERQQVRGRIEKLLSQITSLSA